MLTDKAKGLILALNAKGKSPQEIFDEVKPRTKGLTIQAVRATIRTEGKSTTTAANVNTTVPSFRRTKERSAAQVETKLEGMDDSVKLATIRLITSAGNVPATTQLEFIKSILDQN